MKEGRIVGAQGWPVIVSSRDAEGHLVTAFLSCVPAFRRALGRSLLPRSLELVLALVTCLTDRMCSKGHPGTPEVTPGKDLQLLLEPLRRLALGTHGRIQARHDRFDSPKMARL